jgi:hypothetical protein
MRALVRACAKVPSNPLRRAARVSSVMLAFAACHAARAATFCITDGDIASLQSALATAASNGEDDLLELQIGDYPMGANFLLDYPSVEARALTIEGGYSENFGNACGTPPASPDARLTVLDGGLWRLHLAAGAGSIALKGLTVQGTFGTDAIHAPVEISADPGATGTITTENTMFLGNASTMTSAINFSAAQGAISVQNSVFASNVTFAAINPVRFRSVRNGSLCATLVNSTFAGNLSNLPALYLITPNCSAVAANDIFWANLPGGGIAFANAPGVYLIADDLADLNEATGTQAAGLLSVDPLFDVAFSLQDYSPLRDKGNIGGGVFSPGMFDVGGQPRIYHAELPDIGAFEIQDVIFASSLDVQ